MNIRVMLDFATPEEAVSVLQRISGAPIQVVSRDIDNPAFGAHVQAVRQGDAFVSVPLPPAAATVVSPVTAQSSAPSLSNVGFGQGVTLPAGAIPAPASAVAAASTTAPVAPSGTTAVPPAPTAPALPPAVAAHAPTAPAVPTAPAPGAVTLDRDGLPWDVRIHASTKTLNKDGTWRQKRELDPNVRAAVEAELRQVLSANAAAAGATAAPAATPAPSAVPLPPATAGAAAVPQPPSPAPAPAPAPTASPSEWTFAGLMEAVTPHMMTGTIKQEHMLAALKQHGLSAVGQLSLAPAVTQHVAAELGKIVALGDAK